MSDKFTDAEVKAIATIQKLLNLSTHKNTPPHEAAAAAAKAQKLLLEHNLEASALDRGDADDGAREDALQRGGIYKYTRELWEAVAKLNFCFYWTQTSWERRKTARSGEQERYGITFRHRLVGKKINVAMTQAMATYLEQAIHRLCVEWCREGKHNYMHTDAMAFREGAASVVMHKLAERRREVLDAEDLNLRRAAEAAAKAGMGSTSTALTIAGLAQREEDANRDHLYGEKGYSARMRAEAQARAEERRRERDHYTQWAKNNPEAAREAEEQAYEIQKKEGWYKVGRSGGGSRYKQPTKEEMRQSNYAFSVGRKVGEKISLDQQMENDGSARKRISDR
jgi:hypothetical protein